MPNRLADGSLVCSCAAGRPLPTAEALGANGLRPDGGAPPSG